MRIGVFGGSFDPPHAAHLQVAKAAREQLKLDKVIWVPAFHPPHKDLPATDFKHRLGMVQALLHENPAGDLINEVSEVERSLPPPSYTLHTLQALKNQWGSGHSWFLIIGADNWAIFPSWHEPKAVLAEATLVVYPRQGISLAGLPEGAIRLNCPEIPQESTRYRALLAHSLNPKDSAGFENALNARDELPLPVADYIRTHGLYGFPPPPSASVTG